MYSALKWFIIIRMEFDTSTGANLISQPRVEQYGFSSFDLSPVTVPQATKKIMSSLVYTYSMKEEPRLVRHLDI